MRLFIGLELPKSFKAELFRVENELRALGASGRFVPEDNFHITLSFLGDQSDVYGIATAMREAVRGIRPFTLHLGKYGFFERADGHIAHINVAGDLKELHVLHESLVSALLDGGFACERKRFSPHITLGRTVTYPPESNAAEKLLQLSPSASMMVSGITLFESARQGDILRYGVLHRERF